MIRREFARRAAGVLAALGLGGAAKASGGADSRSPIGSRPSGIPDEPPVEFEHLRSRTLAVTIGPDGLPEYELVRVTGRFYGMNETLSWEDAMRFQREAIKRLPGCESREGRMFVRSTHDIVGWPDKDLDYSIIEATVLVKSGEARRFFDRFPKDDPR